ncbi:MAG: glycerate kinase [Phycisphaerales bacterium JB041]
MREVPSHSAAAEAIVRACIDACDAGRAVRDAVGRLGSMPGSRVLAVGKAAVPMAGAFAEIAREPRRWFVLGPDGATGDQLPVGAEVWAADHPIPSTRNTRAAERLVEWLGEAEPGGERRPQGLLVLLSGGASAMLCAPRDPLTLEELGRMTDALLRCGASINELNAVRKHLEVLKGGGLLREAVRADGRGSDDPDRARVVTLVLSDVLGDPLDVIGSGPTAPDPTTFEDALTVLERHGLLGEVPGATALLRRGREGGLPETLKPGDRECARVEHHVIGNNRLALDAAVARAERLGYSLHDRREMVEGEAADIGRELARSALRLRDDVSASTAPGTTGGACLVWGGETTVTVGRAPGRGGRNQELALAASVELARARPVDGDAEQAPAITIMSLATDGRDGPTDAAGAIVDAGTCARIVDAGLDPADALRCHDSHPALDAAGALIRTGLTGTNVNDVMLALVGR